MDELGRALELDRRVALRAARESIAIPEGWVVLHPGLPDVHWLNMLILVPPVPASLDAGRLTALGDRWLGHLGDRLVRVQDGDAGAALAPPLLDAGWERRRTVFMVFREDRQALVGDPRARRISETELQAVSLAANEETSFGVHAAPGLARRLSQAQAAARAGTTAWCFGAGADGGLQSTCTLFLDPDVSGVRVAMVEEVGTLAAYREQGLAKAVVCAAVRAAREWGAQLITVPADADDWPQLLYAKLGFEPVGVEVAFTLRTPAPPAS